MLDYYTTQFPSRPKLAKEVDLYAREESRKMAILSAKYRSTVRGRGRQAGNPLRMLLVSFFSIL